MPFHIIGSGYGPEALHALRDVVAGPKAADPLAQVTVLVPTNIAGIVARRFLARTGLGGRPGVAGLAVTTIPRLAEQLAAAALHPRRPATRSVVAAAWRSALRGNAGVFAPVAEHPATIRALTQAHTELRDLSGGALDAVAGASTLAADLVRLHRRVTDSLTPQWYDVTELLRRAGAVSGADGAAAVLGSVVLYLPQALTRAEASFVTALAERAEVSVVVGLTGVDRADRVVLQSLHRLGLEDPVCDSPVRPTAHEVLNASDCDDEVRCVVRDVVHALRHTPAHRVAVLYASATPYSRLLHEHFRAADIAVNGAGTLAVHERAVARCLLALLALAQEHRPEQMMPRAEVFRMLAEVPTHDRDGALIPVSRWERISRSASVVSGEGWQRRLLGYGEEEQRVIDREEGSDAPRQGVVDRCGRNIEAADALRRFATWLQQRLAVAAELTGWGELGTWALGLFSDLVGDDAALAKLPLEEQHAAVAVQRTLAGLATLDSLESSADVQLLSDVVEIELSAALPRIGRFGEGVLVAPLSTAIGLDADVTYVVGLAEDICPGRLHEDPLLPQRVREASAGELPSYRDRLDARHGHLLAAFTSAPRVVGSFPRGDLRRSTGRLPSRWLLPTLRQLSGNSGLMATEWSRAGGPAVTTSPSYAGTITTTPAPASEHEWRVRASSARHPLADPVVDAATAMLRARFGSDLTRFDGNLSGAGELPDHAAGQLIVSPTALESYATCPHAYFVQRLLRVQPLEQPEEVLTISPLDIGNLMHESMDDLVRECAGSLPSYGAEWTPRQKQRLRAIAEAKADEFEARGITGHPRLWRRERARILADLDWMLDDDFEHRHCIDARVELSEMAFGMDGKDPVEIVVPGGRVLMRGSADKVDRTRAGAIVVTDIKTGSAKRFSGLKKDPVAGGTKLQLPVYAHAARQRLGTPATDVQAVYWFVRGLSRGERIPVDLAGVETTYAETLDVIVSSIATGLFPQRPPDKPDFAAWRQCDYCNPDGVGHGDARSRWERKRGAPVLAGYVGLVEPDALTGGEEQS